MAATIKRSRRSLGEGLDSGSDAGLQARLAYYSAHPKEIEQRLRELDQEWGLEQTMEMGAAATVLGGFVFGTLFGRKWFLLSLLGGALMLRHALRRDYPLLPRQRGLGLRTPQEIEQERYALKVVRGDFARVRPGSGQERTRLAFLAAQPNGAALQPEPSPAT